MIRGFLSNQWNANWFGFLGGFRQVENGWVDFGRWILAGYQLSVAWPWDIKLLHKMFPDRVGTCSVGQPIPGKSAVPLQHSSTHTSKTFTLPMIFAHTRSLGRPKSYFLESCYLRILYLFPSSFLGFFKGTTAAGGKKLIWLWLINPFFVSWLPKG